MHIYSFYQFYSSSEFWLIYPYIYLCWELCFFHTVRVAIYGHFMSIWKSPFHRFCVHWKSAHKGSPSTFQWRLSSSELPCICLSGNIFLLYICKTVFSQYRIQVFVFQHIVCIILPTDPRNFNSLCNGSLLSCCFQGSFYLCLLTVWL